MPPDQDIEGGHGERQARLKIGPAPVHDLFEMAHERQHREHRLDEHPVLPLPAWTQFPVGRVAFRGMKAGVAQDGPAGAFKQKGTVSLYMSLILISGRVFWSIYSSKEPLSKRQEENS